MTSRYYQCATCVQNASCQQESSGLSNYGMALNECTNAFRSTMNPLPISTVVSIWFAFKLFIKAIRSTPDLPHPLLWAFVIWDGAPRNALRLFVFWLEYIHCLFVKPHPRNHIISHSPRRCYACQSTNHAAQMQRSARIWILNVMHTLSFCETAS